MLWTLSAYETTAKDFFEVLRKNKVDLLLDVRLKNSSQLSGFTKKRDLAYLIPTICGASYIHDISLAPNPILLDGYLKHLISWDEYAEAYKGQLEEMDAVAYFRSHYGQYHTICLLGTETKKRRSHSEVLKNFLDERKL